MLTRRHLYKLKYRPKLAQKPPISSPIFYQKSIYIYIILLAKSIEEMALICQDCLHFVRHRRYFCKKRQNLDSNFPKMKISGGTFCFCQLFLSKLYVGMFSWVREKTGASHFEPATALRD